MDYWLKAEEKLKAAGEQESCEEAAPWAEGGLLAQQRPAPGRRHNKRRKS